MEQKINFSILRNLTASYRILIILTSALIISLLLPRVKTVNYEFEEGSKWKYSDLRAPYDFAIRKTENEIAAEKEAIVKNFIPYYKKNESTTENLNDRILEEYNTYQSHAGGDTALFLSNYKDINIKQIRSVFQKTYRTGILEANDIYKDREKEFLIHIVEGNIISLKPRAAIPTVVQAKNELHRDIRQAGEHGPLLYPVIDALIEPNIFLDQTLSNEFLNQAFKNIATNEGIVRKGDIIINRNSTISKDTYQKLISLRELDDAGNTGKLSYFKSFLAYFVFISVILMFYVLYVRTYVREVFLIFKKMLFMHLWLILYVFMTYFVIKSSSLDLLMIPFCIAPIVIKNFYNQRLAFFTLVAILTIVALFGPVTKDFIILQITAGIMVVIVTKETRYWSKFFLLLLFLLGTYIFTYLFLTYIKNNNLADFNLNSIWWICLNVFLTLLAYPLIPLLERLFGFTSGITLAELSDLNNNLLKELSIKAPGTFQHVLHVATLAEAAAEKIGANSSMARVGALYHDIGKMKAPYNFTENQTNINPHDSIDHVTSAKLIIEHVPEGVKIAKKNGLPNVIIDFIKTHHGTTKVEYFYRKFVKEHADHAVDEKVFTYPGPRPRTKEQVVVMMADTLEAAVKSLINPTEEEINDMVDKLIRAKIEDGQFDRSDITFEDVQTCIRIFKNMLVNMSHIRIAYPDPRPETN
ncbi:MAG: HDIG domain-containing protein [Saprospiraceae bacterium]|nr:HDIG domain-containing protein [Saprospiraceae bacterium]MBX7179356.1 HDIG domain-containing protein [Saprospiraceae bacterium]MCB0592328.1 HDIG domain-containing protein [Saprospiraceae bacterium]MCO5282949.1 HDIG domain-containing protein [Saprospiraceae bacterium]MCO6469640.1 HDIG domain-containing protein [Saprospiraceae bacterium]